MALKEVAVDGMTLEIANAAPTSVEGTITIVGISSLKCKAEGKGIYKADLSIQIANITSSIAGATIPYPLVSATIEATATKSTADGEYVLRVDDTTAMLGTDPAHLITPQIPGTPPVPYPVTFQVKITNAGQTKVKGQ